MQERMNCRILRRELRRDRRKLAAEARRLRRAGIRDACDEWLSDNYYLLRRTADRALDELKKCGTLPAEYGRIRIVEFVREFLQGEELPDFDAIFSVCATEWTAREFDVLRLICECVCLSKALTGFLQKETGEISCAIRTLRMLPEVDFTALCERYSETSRILAQDPDGVYEAMSEETRAQYRHRCYELAQKQGCEETEIARRALQDALRAPTEERHIGFWLFPRSGGTKSSHPRAGVFLFLLRFLLPAVACALLMIPLHSFSAFLFYFPFYGIFRTLLERITLLFVSPTVLPKMEDKEPIPAQAPTLAVISCMVVTPDRCEELSRHLSRMALCNPDEQLRFCLLADFGESPSATEATDGVNLSAMKRMLKDLNRRYGNRFVLLVRPRVWIETQRSYGGWERKRGAILQLVSFFQGGENPFCATAGSLTGLRETRYLILLDSDTNLLLHSARRLVASARHPLNRPVYDEQTGSIVRGYGILSPQIETDVSAAGKTVFSRLMCGTGGFSSYDGPAVDINQELFGETVFTGKGIADVSAMAACLEQAFREEQILSHDILEGGYLRCGYCADIHMTDGCPTTYASWLKRLHRWVRGDCQNFRFLFSKIPTRQGKRATPFSAATRIFLADNLMRAVCQRTPVALAVSAIFFPHLAPGLILGSLLMFSVPHLISAAESLLRGGFFRLSRRYYSHILPDALEALARAVFFGWEHFILSLTVTDAILRSCWRMWVSRRKLLEWTTAAQAEGGGTGSLLSLLYQRWICLLTGAAFAVLGTGWLRLYGMILLSAPLVEWWTRQKLEDHGPTVSEARRRQLMSYCADQWRFYEELCTESEHGLPPDNLQETPVRRVAHRTSPTNIGFYLLSLIAVLRFGFLDEEEFLSRAGLTVSSLEKLEKYHGNLLNWYDTRTLQPLYPKYCSTVDSGNLLGCLLALSARLKSMTAPDAQALRERVDELIRQTDLSVLYHPRRKLFHIGYDLQHQKLSDSYYDLLMSEARLTSYISVAGGQVPPEHWAALGRMIVREGAYTGTVSWTGTAFEYFMPQILLPVRENTLFYETMMFCIFCQKREAERRRLPFGVSESGYFAFDRELNYQYKAQGTPRLALKKERRQDYVVSPYSSFLMLEFAPRSVFMNLRRLRETYGCYGTYGFYEAMDFTPRRVGRTPQPVRSYMAHHVGMSLCAACNYLEQGYLRELFLGGVMPAGEELLDEKIPSGERVFRDHETQSAAKRPPRLIGRIPSEESPDLLYPRVTLLSNGELTAMLSDVGWMRWQWNGMELLRHRRDPVGMQGGLFAAVQCGGEVMPLQEASFANDTAKRSVKFTGATADYFSENDWCSAGMRVTMHRTRPIIYVSVRLRSKESGKRGMKTLLYCEPLLQTLNAYTSHPAYSMLFLQARRQQNDFCFHRRTRAGERPAAMVVRVLKGNVNRYEFSRQQVVAAGEPWDFWSRTDRFTSSGNGLPDPCCALCFSHAFEHGSQEEIRLAISVADTEEAAMQALETENTPDATFRAAQTLYSFASLEGQVLERLLPVFFDHGRKTPEQLGALRQTEEMQKELWSLGISGDRHAVLYRYEKTEDELLLRACLRVFRRLYSVGMPVDLIIICRGGDGYYHDALRQAQRIVTEEDAAGFLQAGGGLFLFSAATLTPGSMRAMIAFSDVVADAEQFLRRPPRRAFRRLPVRAAHPASFHHDPGGLLVNCGEFSRTADFTVTGPHELPWTHLLTNPQFGTMLTDRSLGYTWAYNSRENRLTPWENDTRGENSGERLLLNLDGRIYDLIRGCLCTFSKDHACYRGEVGDLRYSVTVTVEGFCKKMAVSMESDRPIEYELCYLTVPAFGPDCARSRCLTAVWNEKRLTVSNPWGTEFPGEIEIFCNGSHPVCCCDLPSVLSGRWEHHSLLPAAEPCAAVISREKTEPGEKREILFTLRWLEPAGGQIVPHAEDLTGKVCLHSRFPSLDLLVNTWLPHQIQHSRLYGRTAFYQSSGAYGFRDQLQDVCGLMYHSPALAREQILRCCARQFEEGDVLHWWHEYPGFVCGVRTRCSDDALWLCYVTAEYLRFSEDWGLLREEAPFLRAEPLKPEERERYERILPDPENRGTVWEHCVRAAGRITTGEHGLPLIGTCDWNDGFSELGIRERGESVWLAMFGIMVLERMAFLAEHFLYTEQAARYRRRAAELRRSVETQAWDGDHFLRAFDDAGAPLGKTGDGECELDSLTQSFAVFAGVSDEEHRGIALNRATELLWDSEHRLIRIFTPPFTARQVGYLSAYPPGIRENGGQYTHAAVWLARALLLSGFEQKGLDALMMLNPIEKCRDRATAERYEGEPYAMAADVYDNPSCPGRAGWTQYTGAAGWYEQTVLHDLLGVEIRGHRLYLRPHLPASFGSAALSLTVGGNRVLIYYRPCRGGMEAGLYSQGQAVEWGDIGQGDCEFTCAYESNFANNSEKQ